MVPVMKAISFSSTVACIGQRFLSKYLQKAFPGIITIGCLALSPSGYTLSFDASEPLARSKRMVGGVLAEKDAIPQVVKILVDDELKCTGVLIRNRTSHPAAATILTEGECMTPDGLSGINTAFSRSKMTVRFDNVSGMEATAIPVKAIHPGARVQNHLTESTLSHFTLLKIDLSQYPLLQRVVPMMVSYHPVTDTDVLQAPYNALQIAGYGLNGMNENELTHIPSVSLKKNTQCWSGDRSIVNPALQPLCIFSTRSQDLNIKAYDGDRGAPLYYESGDLKTLVGINTQGDVVEDIAKDSNNQEYLRRTPITYFLRTSLSQAQDLIQRHSGINNDLLFTWGRLSGGGETRVGQYKDRELGICAHTGEDGSDAIGSLDLDTGHCICADASASKMHKSYIQLADFNNLIGDVDSAYQWTKWQVTIPVSAMLSSRRQDNDYFKSSNNWQRLPHQHAAIPCLIGKPPAYIEFPWIQLRLNPVHIGTLSGATCSYYHSGSNSIKQANDFYVAVDRRFRLPADEDRN